jgi:hypothetical protein
MEVISKCMESFVRYLQLQHQPLYHVVRYDCFSYDPDWKPVLRRSNSGCYYLSFECKIINVVTLNHVINSHILYFYIYKFEFGMYLLFVKKNTWFIECVIYGIWCFYC